MLLTLLLSLSLLNIVKSDCPAGTVFQSDFNKCYKYVNTPASFLEAEEYCEGLGGYLVSLSSAFENGYVSGIVSGAGSPPKYWIGANLLLTTSWSWISQDSFSFTNWASGQPSDSTTKQCGAVQSGDNKWTAEVCNSALPFVCALSANTTATTGNTCPPPTTCPACPAPTCPTPKPASNPPCDSAPCKDLQCFNGYHLYTGTCRCYKEITFKQNTYKYAESQCESDHGALAKITSSGLNNFIHTIVKKTNPWIGLKCASASFADCKWLDGTDSLGYYNFAKGEPKEAGFVWMNMDGQWLSESFDEGTTAICEKAPTTKNV